jgi:hypothetical protein
MQASDGDEKQRGRSEVCWRVTTATGCRFTCTIHSRDPHVEVRLTTGEEQMVYTTLVATLDAAHAVAQRWLRVIVANGRAEASDGSALKRDLPH